MTRHTAVLEETVGSMAPTDRTMKGRTAAPTRPDNAFTGLIARLFGGVEPVRVVAFTSTLKGEGVTYTLRRAAAELESATGLRPTILEAADLLAGESVGIAEILGSAPLSNRAERPDNRAAIGSAFDVAFVDAGSLESNGAIIGVTRKVDAVVVVVEAGRTAKRDVSRTVETITAAGGIVVGLVLNKRTPVVPAWITRLLG